MYTYTTLQRWPVLQQDIKYIPKYEVYYSIKFIIDWFNKKYNKNLTVENLELFFDEDDYQDYEND